jgi:predicted phage baseplate assembly protein
MLPSPSLDDRDFQTLVDQARQRIRQKCPQWSDHNISDPGITLIENFAMMVEQLIYRLNRVPDRHYIKFLELVGLELSPPGAAEGDVTFELSAPQPHRITVPAGTEVSTDGDGFHEPLLFSTKTDLDIVPCSLTSGRIVTLSADQPVDLPPTDQPNDSGGAGFECFSATLTPGDAMWIGLDVAVPSCTVRLRVDCSVSGVGVNPERPPYRWEAWCAVSPDQSRRTGVKSRWLECEVGEDGTKALNQPGDVLLHVPSSHVLASPHPVAGRPLGWLRCVLQELPPGEPTYQQPPHITSITAATMGGTAPVMHARVIHDEVVGVSDGTPGQRFSLQHKPVVLPGVDSVVSVTVDNSTTTWTGVRSFADQDADSKCFHIDPVAGEIVFGPLVRGRDDHMRPYIRQYGKIPEKSAILRILAYRTGGGAGNVAKGSIRVLKSSVPYIARVQNRHATTGGAEAETIEEIKVRGPLVLQSRGRAVTARDFELLARDASSEVGRAVCLTAAKEDKETWGRVRVLLVPNVEDDLLGAVPFDELTPSDEVKARVEEYLEQRKLVGTTLSVEKPKYRWLKVVASVTALPGADPRRVEGDVIRALISLLHPLRGGGGDGWPIGQTVQLHQVQSVFPWVKGVDNSREVIVELYPVVIDDRGQPVMPDASVSQLRLERDELVYSYNHEARVSVR